jgi:hypothetical protein
LSYVDDSFNLPVVTMLNRGYQVGLLAIKAYRDHFEALHQPEMTEDDWMQVTKPIMNGFIMPGGVLSTPATSPVSAPFNVNAVQRSNTALEIFRKTTRREPSHFINIKIYFKVVEKLIWMLGMRRPGKIQATLSYAESLLFLG